MEPNLKYAKWHMLHGMHASSMWRPLNIAGEIIYKVIERKRVLYHKNFKEIHSGNLKKDVIKV